MAFEIGKKKNLVAQPGGVHACSTMDNGEITHVVLDSITSAKKSVKYSFLIIVYSTFVESKPVCFL